MNLSRLPRLLSCTLLAFVITACGINNKETYLESFESFIVNIEQAKKISKDEMTEIKKDYLDYTETFFHKFENELSASEKEYILELKARYYAVMAKQGLKDVGESLKELGEQASEFINEILE